MEKASGGSFARTTRKTAEDEGRRRGRLGNDAKHIRGLCRGFGRFGQTTLNASVDEGKRQGAEFDLSVAQDLYFTLFGRAGNNENRDFGVKTSCSSIALNADLIVR